MMSRQGSDTRQLRLFQLVEMLLFSENKVEDYV